MTESEELVAEARDLERQATDGDASWDHLCHAINALADEVERQAIVIRELHKLIKEKAKE